MVQQHAVAGAGRLGDVAQRPSPIPPSATASISASSTSRRRTSSRGRGIPHPSLAGGLEPAGLEVQVATRHAAREEADDHPDRAPLVDALAHERASRGLRATSWAASVVPPGERCRQVHDAPGSTSVTSQTSSGNRGWLISKRRPTSIPVRRGA